MKNILNIYDFGLGFIRVKLTATESLNVYLDNIQRFDDHEQPHNHQYSFNSKIIRGKLREVRYLVEKDGDYSLTCTCGNTDSQVKEKVSYSISEVNEYHEGQTYYCDRSVYHSVDATHGTVTLFVKDLFESFQDAYVIGAHGKKYESPYTKDDLWNMVQPYIGDLVNSDV